MVGAAYPRPRAILGGRRMGAAGRLAMRLHCRICRRGLLALARAAGLEECGRSHKTQVASKDGLTLSYLPEDPA